METVPQIRKKFKHPEEELQFLREHVREQERLLTQEGRPQPVEQIASETLRSYQTFEPQEILEKEHILPEQEQEEITLRLSPEPHDRKMEELLAILLDRGIKNVQSVIKKLNNPHIDDDFHRFLVQYLYATNHVPGLKEGTPMFKGINMVLLEITLPAGMEDEQTFKEIIGAMEQFYAGMQSIGDGKQNKNGGYFTLEIAVSADHDDLVVYAAVPRAKRELFEKQVLGFYEHASVDELTDDYNIFHPQGAAAGAYATLVKPPVLPLRTHEDIDHDPMNAVLNVFSKLKTTGEGAALQFTIVPAGDRFITQFNHILDEVRSGKSIKEAYSSSASFGKAFLSTAKDIFSTDQKKGDQPTESADRIELLSKKLKSTILTVGIRVIASADTIDRSKEIIHDITSAFHQFTDPNGNGLSFTLVTGKQLQQLSHDYSYRLVRDTQLLPLSIREQTSLFHFPVGVSSTPHLRSAKAGVTAAPTNMVPDGIHLGTNIYRGVKKPVYIEPEARMRHFYVIGQTGTGKTNILKNMIIQDIQRGHGCCFIDPHGSDVEDILANVPRERVDDVIYFDPAYTKRPMGLNMLEYNPDFPEQKTFVVDEMLSIFNKLFDMKVAGGPMFEQYFRNATMLAIDDPREPATLLEISRVLADADYRNQKLAHSTNPIVVQFWREIASKAGGEAGLQNIVPYITSKFDVFLTNEIMRPIIGQAQSAFNFRTVMDEQKILLVNLSKGRLGELNANLLGLIIVGKILMAALSRVDTEHRPDFFLYIDEFQNVTTNSISQILSEARKYRLGLHIAHQFTGQLSDEIKNAVFGNVGNMALFRVGADDASYLESQLAPTFSKEDLMQLDNFHAYVKLLVHNQPTKPFNIVTNPAPEGSKQLADELKELSYRKYGHDRTTVEQEIISRFHHLEQNG